jgi:hypothetical protein
VRRAFRDEFRNARTEALRDAEGCTAIFVAAERLGACVVGPQTGLGRYESALEGICRRSVSIGYLADRHPEYHATFQRLFRIFVSGRNQAVHVGAFARNLTRLAIELALFLEDGLQEGFVEAADFMVREPVCAEHWEPLGFIRQKMLLNSFSFLPARDLAGNWRLLSDRALVRFTRNGSEEQRKERLALRLDGALEKGDLQLEEALTCPRVSRSSNSRQGWITLLSWSSQRMTSADCSGSSRPSIFSE